MKKTLPLALALLLVFALTPACDVVDGLKITPVPTPTLSPSPTPAQTPMPTPSPAPTPTPTPEPTPTPTPKPDPHSLPADMAISFEDPGVEKFVRKFLNRPQGDITVGDMRALKLDYQNSFLDNLSGHDIRSIEDLRYCENLICLSITSNHISDISPLAGMKSLELIELGGNPVTDASPVLRMPNLKHFSAFETRVTDISALRNTKGLQQFHSNNKLDDYTPLLNHKGLKYVTLYGITDEFFRSLLANCKGLTQISVHQSEIREESLTLLKGRVLFDLDLGECGIKNLSALAGLKRVEMLRFPNNDITDISPLKGIRITEYLDLSGNNISDWSPLAKMTGLKELLVTGNPVTDSPVLDKLEKKGCKIYR